MAFNPHGSFVLVEVIKILKSSDLEQILKNLVGKTIELALNEHGSKVLSAIMKYCKNEE